MSHKSVLQESHLDICSFLKVFAFGFVGSILFYTTGSSNLRKNGAFWLVFIDEKADMVGRSRCTLPPTTHDRKKTDFQISTSGANFSFERFLAVQAQPWPSLPQKGWCTTQELPWYPPSAPPLSQEQRHHSSPNRCHRLPGSKRLRALGPR